jgi:hypothetical protein
MSTCPESELLFNTEFIPIEEESQEKEQEQEQSFNCPVCYSDGANSGVVTPSNCTHKICLECYTNIVLKTSSCICPMCRVPYVKKQEQPQQQQQQPQQQEERILPFRPTTPSLRIPPHLNSDVMANLIHYQRPIDHLMVDYDRALDTYQFY